jgi:MGT family glycosyltransferase
VTTLVISPDYASHYYGLAALGHAAPGRVVVATGPALRGRVQADGFGFEPLQLGAGHNDGTSGAGGSTDAEQAHLDAFFAATRAGMVATVSYQVRARERDMLWRPEHVLAQLGPILERVRPRHVIVDQLAFGATLALRALERRFVAFLPSHPCQLPPFGEPDGFPARFPRELTPEPSELMALRALCERQTRRFTRTYNATLARLNPLAAPVREAVSAPAPDLTLVAYPAELAPDAERPGVALVGSVIRRDSPCAALREGLTRRRADLPTVYVSLGTFLSARTDVLAAIADALRSLSVNVVLVTGVSDPGHLGPVPDHWHVTRSTAQVDALSMCDAVICHGGNNTVMEALTHGLPVLAGPMSSDQFVAAEDLRRGGVGDAFDPNRASAEEIAGRVSALLQGPAHERAQALGRRLRERPGAVQAWQRIEQSHGP